MQISALQSQQDFPHRRTQNKNRDALPRKLFHIVVLFKSDQVTGSWERTKSRNIKKLESFQTIVPAGLTGSEQQQ